MAYWFKYTYSHEQAHFSYVYGTTEYFLIIMFISFDYDLTRTINISGVLFVKQGSPKGAKLFRTLLG